MKFLYCRTCKTIQKRNWYSYAKCRQCGEKAVILYVKTGIVGYVSYAATFAAMVLLAANIAGYDLGLGVAQLYLIFGLLIASMVSMFFEIGREDGLARAKANDPHLR